MGVIRGILLVFVAVLLFLSLIVGNVLWTLNLSLDYNNVKPEMRAVLDNVLEGQNLDMFVEANLGIMELYCQTNSEYVFDYGSEYSFTLPCSVVSEGSDAVINYMTNNFIDEFYYQDYDCEFMNCFETAGPFFLVSQKAKDYWSSKAYIFLVSSLALFGLLFLLAEKKSNAFIIGGALLVLASLPFAKLDLLLSFLSDKFILSLLTIFFTEAYTVFAVSVILGIVLLVFGVLLKIFKIGLGISNFFSKFSKKRESSKSEPLVKSIENKIKEKKPAKKIKKSKKKGFFSKFFKPAKKKKKGKK